MEKACGLDVHKDSVFACILNEQGEKVFEKRFGTLIPDLTDLHDVLVEYGCARVAISRKMLVIIYNVLKTSSPFDESIATSLYRLCVKIKINSLRIAYLNALSDTFRIKNT